MLLAVMSFDKEYILKDIAEQFNIDYRLENVHGKISNKISIFSLEKISHILIDINEIYFDEVDDRIEAVKTIRQISPKVKIGFIANDYDLKSEMIIKLKELGFNDIVFSSKEQFLKPFIIDFLNDNLDSKLNVVKKQENDNRKEIDTIINNNINLDNHKKKSIYTIGILGSQSRIGNSTVCMQCCQFFKSLNTDNNVIYIERNDSKFIDDIKNTYEDYIEINKEVIQYNNIYLAKSINGIASLYDKSNFIVYDYGAFNNNMDLSSFFEKDMSIIVLGSSPSEMKFSNQLLLHTYKFKNVHYIFNFVHENEKADILFYMGEQRYNVSFLEYTPDMFTFNLNNINIFNYIFNNIITKYDKGKEKKEIKKNEKISKFNNILRKKRK
ncbi:hypothetical protein [Anaerofustis butyriciformans]|uniref:hypothetical protein n=1 Tax=Anaerofustis butyriciformans TaxID=3108533 RepID=UPI002E358FEE|nr:hypothetical protein [Anaerofustis sp. HA2171]